MASPFEKFITKKKAEVVQRATNAFKDESNMAKWLKSPEGVLFSLKQTGLQLMQPNLDNTVPDRLRIYNPLFPLLAIANINLPIKPGVYRHLAGFSIGEPNYVRTKQLFNENSGVGMNRLIRAALDTQDITLSPKKPNVTFFYQSDASIFKGILENKKVEIRSLRDVNGPGSFLGIGGTRYYKYTSNLRNDEVEQEQVINRFKSTQTERTIKTDRIVSEYRRSLNTPQDQLRVLADEKNNQWYKEYETSDYTKKDIKNSIPYLQKYDSKNQYGKNKLGFSNKDDVEWSESTKVPLIIQGETEKIQLKAYISNLSFGSSATWSDTSFVGRPDILKIFDKNTRNIKFDVLFVPDTLEELKKNIKNIDKIIQFTYAKNINTALSGIVVYVTLGKLFVNEPCILNSAPVTVPNESPWCLSMEIPMYYQMNFDLFVIGNTSPYYNNIWLNAAKTKVQQSIVR